MSGKKCSHEDTRLTCSECSKPICSQCLVQCPVGFRCKACCGTDKKETGARTRVVKTFFAAALVGLISGWIMPFIDIPFVSCFICFFMGIYGGRWLVKFIDHRALGAKAAPTVVFGTLLGMSFSPLCLIPVIIIGLLGFPLTHAGTTIVDSMGGILNVLFNPVCFFAGILRPTIWGEFR